MEAQRQPPQHQGHQPGIEKVMMPRPEFEPRHPGAAKLRGRVALVTGGDSGIGRAVAIAMAREGADVAIVYLEEHEDARETQRLIEAEGAHALLLAGDVGSEQFCISAVERVIAQFGHLDILVNNAAEQHEVYALEELTASQLEQTFRTNVFGYFYMTKAAMPHLHAGASIINTTSITAFEGHETLLDYSATKGAIVTFTRSLSQLLMDKGIRVNAVAPGPIWTPLIPASFDAEKTSRHGASSPMKRAGQPNEVAPSFVFLASDDASYMSGQILHPNGGTIVGG
jgi:NAD(P)-dependent dehydrogenase (short-subunit alcohol dehydrogenase family)